MIASAALRPLELASGVVCGRATTVAPLPPAAGTTRAALTAVLEATLAAGPTFVTFSGGRDSSVLLALAADAARRGGWDLPVPVTYRFPGHESTYEDEYQDAVIAALGIKHWEILRPLDGELDCTGPVARRAFDAVGLRWPFNTFFLLPLIDRSVGGTFVTAVGGDELLSPGTNAWLARALTLQRRPRVADVRWIAALLAPKALRARRLAAKIPPTVWLTAAGAAAMVAAHAADLAAVPLRCDRELRDTMWPSRYLELLVGSLGDLGTSQGVPVINPFLEPSVVASAAAEVGAAGYRDRTAFVTELVGELLPVDVRRRPTKAMFDSVFWTATARRWADGLDPATLPVDRDLVDAQAAVEAWQGDRPEARSFLLAQSCAFASTG